MTGHQPINEDLGILQEGLSCPVCGNWVEPDIKPVLPMNKQDFKIGDNPRSNNNMAAARKKIAELRQLRKQSVM